METSLGVRRFQRDTACNTAQTTGCHDAQDPFPSLPENLYFQAYEAACCLSRDVGLLMPVESLLFVAPVFIYGENSGVSED